MIQFDNAVERYGKLILKELKEAGITCWVAGGAVRDYFSGVHADTDFDLFFPSEEMFDKCETYFTNNDADVLWESSNGVKLKVGKKVFDLVKKFFPDPQATINEFDFTVSMFAVDTTKVYHGETSFIDLAKRQLMINKITYPASTMQRAFKYYKKGFVMCAGEMRKMVESIQNMPKVEKPKESESAEEDTGSGEGFFSGID